MSSGSTPAARRSDEHVPESIVRVLRRLVRRARLVLFLRGSFLVLCVSAAIILCLMALDAALVPSNLPARLTLSAIGYGFIGWAFVRWLLNPLVRSYSLAGMARLIEARHPEYHEVISSAVELLASRQGDEPAGSERLIAEVARQAQARAMEVRPEREISLRVVRTAAAAGTAALLVLISFFAWKPRQARLLFVRVWIPFANLPTIYASSLQVTPGDAVLPVGGRLTVTASVRGQRIPSHARIEVRDQKRTDAFEMAPRPPDDAARDQQPHFVWQSKPLYHAVEYRVTAGRAVSRWYQVRVSEPPRLEGIDVDVQYPAYTGIPPRHTEGSDGAVRGPDGTLATIHLIADKPLANAAFLLNDKPYDAVDSAPGPAPETWTFRLKLKTGMVGQWRALLQDADGLETRTPPCPIEIVPDQPPTLTISTPAEKRLSLPPWAVLPIRFTAEDDFGVRNVTLHIRIRGRDLPPVSLLPNSAEGGNPSDVPQRVIRAAYTLRLEELPLEKSSRFQFQLAAEDSFPASKGGPHKTLSPIFRVDLRATAPDFRLRQTERTLTTVAKNLKTALERIAQAKRNAENARRNLERRRSLDGEARQAQEEKARQSARLAAEAARTLRESAETLKQAPAARRIAASLRETADNELARAVRELADVPLAAQRPEQSRLLKSAGQDLETAEKNVFSDANRLLDQVENLQQARNLQQLAARQRQLADARRALEAAPEDQAAARLSHIGAAERTIAERLAEITARSPEATQAFLRRQERLARTLADSVEDLAREQRALAEAARPVTSAATPVLRKLDELAGKQHEIAAETAHFPQADPAIRPALQAERALRGRDLDEAMKAMDAARNALQQSAEQAARTRQKPGEQTTANTTTNRDNAPSGSEKRQPNAERLAALAKRQEALRQQAAQLAEQLEAARAESARSLWQHLEREQQRVAEQLAALQNERRSGAKQSPGDVNGAASRNHTEQQPGRPAPAAHQQQTQNPVSAGPAGREETTAKQSAPVRTEAGRADEPNGTPPPGEPAPAPEHPPVPGTPVPSSLDALTGEALRHAREAARALQERAAAHAAGEAKQAHASLEQALRALASPKSSRTQNRAEAARESGREPTASGQSPSGDRPAVPPLEFLPRIEGLAARQGRIARALEELTRGRPERAVSAAQESIAEQTAAAAETARSLSSMTRAASNQDLPAARQATEAAERAAHTLDEARQEADRAARLAAAQAGASARSAESAHSPAPSSEQVQPLAEAQNRTAATLDSAVRELAAMARAAAAASGTDQKSSRSEPSAANPSLAEALARAAAAAQTAAAQPSTPRVAHAAQALDQAARQAAAAAAPAPLPETGQQTGETLTSTDGSGQQDLAAPPESLRRLGLTAEEWGRLPGSLKTRIMRMDMESVPPEYRERVQRYFVEVAREAARGGNAP